MFYPEGYNGGKHNLGFDAVAELPYQLSDPVAILKSDTQPNSFVVVTEYIDEHGYPVVTAVHMNKSGKIEPANQIASMYGKRDMSVWAENQREKGNILYEKQNKRLESIALAGLQLPSLYSESDPLFNNSIPNSGENVNEAAKNVQYNSNKIDGFEDLNKDLDRLIGMYKGNENTQTLYEQMKSAVNEYIQTYNKDAAQRAIVLAASIDESLVGHSYTRKGSGKSSAKSQNNRVTTTFSEGEFVDTLLSYNRSLTDTARSNSESRNQTINPESVRTSYFDAIIQIKEFSET